MHIYGVHAQIPVFRIVHGYRNARKLVYANLIDNKPGDIYQTFYEII